MRDAYVTEEDKSNKHEKKISEKEINETSDNSVDRLIYDPNGLKEEEEKLFDKI